MVVKDELELLLTHADFRERHIPILFFANKMDMPEALSSVKIAAGANKFFNSFKFVCVQEKMSESNLTGISENLEMYTITLLIFTF